MHFYLVKDHRSWGYYLCRACAVVLQAERTPNTLPTCCERCGAREEE